MDESGSEEIKYADDDTLIEYCVEFFKLTTPSFTQRDESIIRESFLNSRKKGFKSARSGIKMAVNDTIAASAHFEKNEVSKIDHHLLGKGLPTLSSIRKTYSSSIRRIICQSILQNDIEYFAAKSILDDTQEGSRKIRSALQKLVTEYEER